MRITDPRAIRALAHPLRLDLLEALTMLGPSTAARCGRRLGVSQASCSFHLRQLAKYGFVEPAPAGADRRERVWQLVELWQTWASEPVTDQLDRVFVQREAERMLGWTVRRAAEPQEWQDAAFVGGVSLPVTGAELLEIRARLRAVLDPYVRRLTDGARRPPGARFVRVFLAGTPAGPDPDDSTTPVDGSRETRDDHD